MSIWTLEKKEEAVFLRRPTIPFDFNKHPNRERRELIKKMRAEMKKAQGIGLSANQIGLDCKIFVAQVENKFYAIFNPIIIKTSTKIVEMEEGCLSVPQTFGQVKRPEKITLEGQDVLGKKIKIKAWGLLARVFQHEVDHLNGILFINKTKELYKITPSEKTL